MTYLRPLMIALPLILFCGVLSAQEKASFKYVSPTSNGSIHDRYAILNINGVSSWASSFGKMSQNGVTGLDGTLFPRGKVGIVYRDGFFWGAQAYVDSGRTEPAPFDQVIRIGGARYISAARPGRIIDTGSLAVPADPDTEESRIYRIRRDYFTMSETELRLDAAETFAVRPGLVSPEQMQEIRDHYDMDWQEWPVQFGAPFIDRNGNGLYDPPPSFGPDFLVDDLIQGNFDEPGIHAGSKDNPADQVLWTVFNDLIWPPSFEPLGLELQLTQWGFKSRYEFRFGFFYRRLRMINKGGVRLDENGTKGSLWIDDMYLGQWSDVDLGNAGDDLVGCDTTLQLGFFYNADESDRRFEEYMLPPPSPGYIYLQGPRIRYEGESAFYDNGILSGWKNLPMTSFVRLHPQNPYADPCGRYKCVAIPWYKALRGYKKTAGEDLQLQDFPPGMKPSKFPLAGDPVKGTGYIDELGWKYSPYPDDRRILMSSGPFSLAPGDTQEVVVAFLVGMGADRLSSISMMKHVARQVKRMYPYHAVFSAEDEFQLKLENPPPSYYSLRQNYPNPFREETRIEFVLPKSAQVKMTIYDVLGREVATLLNSTAEIGAHHAVWNGLDRQGRPVPSGVYFCKLQADHIEISRKIFLLR